MDKITKEIILDLLPIYIAGEASEDTKKLVEEFALKDKEVEKILKNGDQNFGVITSPNNPTETLEFEILKKLQNKIRKKMFYSVFITAVILLIPFIAMQFTEEVNWDFMDFLVMGILLIGSAFLYIFISNLSNKNTYRLAIAISIIGGFLLIWVNLAVGIIGSENNPLNLLYLLVFITGAIGAYLVKLKPMGMAKTMFGVSLVQFIIPFIAILFNTKELNSFGNLSTILLLNSFFTALFAISGILFRKA